MSLNSKIADIENTTRKNFTRGMSIGNKKSSVPETILANTQNIQKNISGTLYTPKNIVGKAKGSLRRVVNTVSEIKQGISDTKRVLDVYDMLGIQKPGAKKYTGRGVMQAKPLDYKWPGKDGYSVESMEYDYSEGSENGLQAFYRQFGDSSSAVETIDPLQTFECEFRFYPNFLSPVHVDSNSYYEASVVGRLWSNIEFQNSGEQKNPPTDDLIVNLGIYIQKFSLPNVLVDGVEDVTTLVGKFPVPGNLVQPSDNSFSLEMVNTESPVIENVFYPWMRETTLPWWSYDSQPFTTATITLDFTEHADVKYHFFGCRPTQIMLIQPDQAPSQSMTRNVQFTFDFMSIESGKPKDIVA